jgi:hypothetical protein
MNHGISFSGENAARYGTAKAEFLALANPVRAFFQTKNQLNTLESESFDFTLARRSMSEMARWWNLEDYEVEALTSSFGHTEVARMAYGSKIPCAKVHLNTGSHWALHVEPSRWLRLSYLLDCGQYRVMLSSTLDSIDRISENHKWNYAMAHKGLTVESVVKDCLDLADFAFNKHAYVLDADEYVNRTEKHFSLGLKTQVGMTTDSYTSRGREFFEERRHETFKNDFTKRGW